MTVNNCGIIKECRNKHETLINEAILDYLYNPFLNKKLSKLAMTLTLSIFD